MKIFVGVVAIAALATAAWQIVTLNDGSGTLTAGNVSQVVFPQNSNRTYLECQNPITATETLFININNTASTAGGSFELSPGGSIRFMAPGQMVPFGQVSVNAATTGHRWVCKSS